MKANEYAKLSKEERKKVPFKEVPMINKIFLLVILAVFVVTIGMCFHDASVTPTKPSSSDIAYHAKSVTETAVKTLLKSPSTAKFTDVGQEVNLSSDSTVIVKGFVDAQNSFGAMMRSGYYVKLKWIGDIYDNSSWITLEAKLVE